jgi:hypothetical protein
VILCAVATRTFIDEEDVLDRFWAGASQPEHYERMDLLRYLLDVEIERPRDWDRDAVRRESERVDATLTADRCFVCRCGDRRLIWHHPITVEHGGSASPRNRVRLCNRHHKVLHPWMKDWPGDQGSWTRVREFIDALKDPGYQIRVEPPREKVYDDEGHDWPPRRRDEGD